MGVDKKSYGAYSLEDMKLAIMGSVKVGRIMEEEALAQAEIIMNRLGEDMQFLDNYPSPDERAVLYMLEDQGLITTSREETTLFDGREWRTHWWVFPPHLIEKYGKIALERMDVEEIEKTVEESEFSCYDKLWGKQNDVGASTFKHNIYTFNVELMEYIRRVNKAVTIFDKGKSEYKSLIKKVPTIPNVGKLEDTLDKLVGIIRKSDKKLKEYHNKASTCRDKLRTALGYEPKETNIFISFPLSSLEAELGESDERIALYNWCEEIVELDIPQIDIFDLERMLEKLKENFTKLVNDGGRGHDEMNGMRDDIATVTGRMSNLRGSLSKLDNHEFKLDIGMIERYLKVTKPEFDARVIKQKIKRCEIISEEQKKEFERFETTLGNYSIIYNHMKKTGVKT